eukprot:TRINITY_DN1789_c0_g1_i2.p1 TRINITY_DN1789_c0_g1~~TRINITY_DN1789_c0_g1_i2.p1  ORF type:complete len:311 (-),score=36.83 TRINITY_DN1789_c0_g1_i2:47-922(-)
MARFSLFLVALVAIAAAQVVSSSPGMVHKGPRIEHVVVPLPMADSLPSAFDWRNVSGTSYVTVSRQQHLPQYCGSCWAFSTTSAFSDRIQIARKSAWPAVEIAPQVLLNCLSNNTCDGGDPNQANEYMRNGIPNETCSPYQAKDNECTAENICQNCNLDMTDPTAECFAVTNPPMYYVEEHGLVNGTDNMKNEIFQRGPIVCGIAVTEAFLNYTNGVFVDTTNATAIDHAIAVTGWGEEGGIPYWVVRNSWGSFWGELGFVQLAMGNLSIETDCYWATPTANSTTGGIVHD